MTKREMRPFWTGLAAGAGIAVLAAAVFFTNSESVLKSSFASALTRSSLPAREVAAASPVSGSEAFWLSQMRLDGNAPMTKTISVGDQISLSLNGDRHTFEVATVAEIPPQTTAIETSAGTSHFILVTARDTSDANARPVRFMMELDTANAMLVGRHTGRAL